MSELFEKVLKSRLLRRAANTLAAGRAVKLAGVWGSSAPLAAAAIGRMRRAVVLAVTAHLDEADDDADDVEVFTGRPAQLFPAWEADPTGGGANDDIAATRLRLCNLLSQPVNLRDEPVTVIVAPVMALMQPVPSAAAMAASRKPLRRGGIQDVEELVAWLVDAGFDRVEQVEQQGDFARRGGIVDIFPSGATQAVRVEFFGDQIESIRRVDLDTQRSTDAIEGYDLTTASPAPGRETSTASLLDYLPADAIVCLIEPGAVDVYRPGARRVPVPEGPVGAEVVLREDAQAQHVARVEGQDEYAPAVDVLVVEPGKASPDCRKVTQSRGKVGHGTPSVTMRGGSVSPVARRGPGGLC
ncbi:MAG: hypothetical protein ABSH10_02480 [Phycisphaerae bacterium]